jgi:hypothetical protein
MSSEATDSSNVPRRIFATITKRPSSAAEKTLRREALGAQGKITARHLVTTPALRNMLYHDMEGNRRRGLYSQT